MTSPVVGSAEMQDAEHAAFAHGISAEGLMNEAGAGIAQAVRQFFPRPGRCFVFAGKGNNGGDALVAATHLKRAGWHTDVHLAFPEAESGDLLRKKIAAFRDAAAVEHASGPALIVLDGLLGLGSKRPLRDPILTSAREINRLRRETGAFVFAIDLPTGLDGDTGETDQNCVVADFTVTICAVKRGLVADKATNFVGRLEVINLAGLKLHSRNEEVACAASLRDLLPRRDFDVHKNQFGRIGIIAGSRGFAGAAVMTTWGALRAGAGLVEVFVPENIYTPVAAAMPFEAMVKPIRSYRSLSREKVDVWAVGPGLGTRQAPEILKLVRDIASPMVIDADALNVIAEEVNILKNCRGSRLLTPHPGEMKRLILDEKISREALARKFTKQFPVTLLLKGSRTIVAEGGEKISYNTTGNPGMATGGMGDVLTGVCAALLGQKLSPFNAARAGAWVCGRAAEIAVFDKCESEQSLLPRDVLASLGSAFRELQK